MQTNASARTNAHTHICERTRIHKQSIHTYTYAYMLVSAHNFALRFELLLHYF